MQSCIVAMNNEIKKLEQKDFPSLLKEIPDAPKQLFVRGVLPNKDTKLLCVVGSRKYSNYGKDVCEELISGLSGYNITIVSGLALGMDSIAHKSAIKAGLKTIAIPGSGLNDNVLYPASNYGLAQDILKNSGTLVSEFEPDFKATLWSFPKRNRIMAGMSHATLIIEAGERSGTLITSRLALDYNRDVFVVPNSVFAQGSVGSNRLIRQGAMPVTSSKDILNELGFELEKDNIDGGPTSINVNNCTTEEKEILDLLNNPLSRDELIRTLNIGTSKANQLLTIMEIKGLIKEELGMIRKIL